MDQPPYINKVLFQGEIISKPTLISLTQRTNLTSFRISAAETWRTPSGEHKERRNKIVVEVVGKDARRIAETAQVGFWATIVGYIRSEQSKGQDRVKVRTLDIKVWRNDGQTTRGGS